MSLLWFSSFFCLTIPPGPAWLLLQSIPSFSVLPVQNTVQASHNFVQFSFPTGNLVGILSRDKRRNASLQQAFCLTRAFRKILDRREGGRLSWGRQREIGVARAACIGNRFRVLVCCYNLESKAIERSICSYITESLKSIIYLGATTIHL